MDWGGLWDGAAKAASAASAFAAEAAKQAEEAAVKAAAEASRAAEGATRAAREAGLDVDGVAALAEQLRKNTVATAEAAETKLRGLAGQQAEQQWEPTPEDLAAYGIAPPFVEFLAGLTVRTFRDFPTDVECKVDVGPRAEAQGPWALTPWQEIHARLVLWAVPEINDYRYVLCPRRMSEERFWAVYFVLVRSKLADFVEPDDPAAEPGLGGEAGAAAEAAAAAGAGEAAAGGEADGEVAVEAAVEAPAPTEEVPDKGKVPATEDEDEDEEDAGNAADIDVDEYLRGVLGEDADGAADGDDGEDCGDDVDVSGVDDVDVDAYLRDVLGNDDDVGGDDDEDDSSGVLVDAEEDAAAA